MKTSADILTLGNPLLYDVSELVKQDELAYMRNVVDDLHHVMMDFRKLFGFGKAIAAPQIGVRKRLIYMHIDKPVVIINPEFEYKSEEMFEMWDNCMSFPTLMVKLNRHKSCVIKFMDLKWNEQRMEVSEELSELLQHEYDHLDGILATQRAVDDKSFKIVNSKKL